MLELRRRTGFGGPYEKRVWRTYAVIMGTSPSDPSSVRPCEWTHSRRVARGILGVVAALLKPGKPPRKRGCGRMVVGGQGLTSPMTAGAGRACYPLSMSDAFAGNSSLTESAVKFINEALAAWIEADHAKVIANAPVALEHVAKSALWDQNPVLLALLDQNHAKSFFSLATAPDLQSPPAAHHRPRRCPEPPRVHLRGQVSDRRGHAAGDGLIARGGLLHAGQADAESAQHVAHRLSCALPVDLRNTWV